MLGSSAEVERIWSAAKHILSEKGNRLKPHVLRQFCFKSTGQNCPETILFLKYNFYLRNRSASKKGLKPAACTAQCALLGDQLVAEAMRSVGSARSRNISMN